MVEVFRSARDSDQPLLLSVVNWGEVYYITLREAGLEQADEVAERISALPIEIVPADLKLTKEAAVLKSLGKIAYADCFAAALAKITKSQLVTGDPEFKQVENTVKILWLE